MIATSARKRGAKFLLEKPLVSRLPFEVEQPLPIPNAQSGFPAPKRLCVQDASAAELDEELDGHPNLPDEGETSDMHEVFGTEESNAADVEFSERGCWLAGWGGKQGRSRSRGDNERERARSGVDLGLPLHEIQEEQAAALPAAEISGPGQALVQLKIDAMFAAPRLARKASSEREPQQPDVDPQDGVERVGATSEVERVMDVDSCVAGADAGEGEGGPACYACRGGLGTEGGDVLCSFCDRAACQGCWQKCIACELPHCSLCLSADYSSEFESYFCPPCYQDRRRESC